MRSVVRTITVGVLAAVVLFGCSNSTPPPSTNYPLTLTLTGNQYSGNVALFELQVTKNGQPFAGAKLLRIDAPSNATIDLGMTSDTNGKYDTTGIVLTDTLSAVAFQAVKDTLKSNYVRWGP
ncbi:MAG TPA: hypothetical protein VFD13_06465 [Candidatus Kapabacteria bacterium]|nr:hypothetical protein [Candidatus Kapabacteria bacterium]